MQNRHIKNEQKFSKFINVIGHFDGSTLIDKSGRLIKFIELQGINYITQDDIALDVAKLRRNNLFKNISSEFAIYTWEIKRKINDYVGGEFKPGFANHLNEKYKAHMENNAMFHKKLYLGIVTKEAEGIINKCFSFINQLGRKYDKELQHNYLLKNHKALNDLTENILNTFAAYRAEVLSIYTKVKSNISAPLSLLSQIINYDQFDVLFNKIDAERSLPRKRIFFNNKSGTLSLRAADQSEMFACVLSIKDYCHETYQGLLDKLDFLKCEYTLTQSYRFYDRQIAKSHIRHQQKDMQQSNEESERLKEKVDDAYDDAASGETAYGIHHLTLVPFANTIDELNKAVGQIVAEFANVSIATVREEVALETSFYAQLPGNFSFIPRGREISTKNLAGFVSFHNLPRGRKSNNHWGNAVSIFETVAGTPYYFNFHHKDVGNFLVFGPMGSGKTVLIGFLIAQSMKFGGKRIIFDKDRGLEILVRALDGVYTQLKPGTKTSFNPCQLEDTESNRAFLFQLFKKMLTLNNATFTEADAEIVKHAIDGMYRLNKADRQLHHIASFFGAKYPMSLRARFDEWHSDGAYAWAFDNAEDLLNLRKDVCGFDVGALLKSECKTPILMYLFYRLDEALTGERGIIFADEGWALFDDEYFQEKLNDYGRTPRKKNNVFGLATQIANDTANSAISKAMNASAYCKVFFPDPSADHDIYINEFGLSEREYELVKTMPDTDHCFLLVHGQGASKESIVLRLNLKRLPDEVAVISAREETVLLLDEIRKEIGDFPNLFLPQFDARRKTINVRKTYEYNK